MSHHTVNRKGMAVVLAVFLLLLALASGSSSWFAGTAEAGTVPTVPTPPPWGEGVVGPGRDAPASQYFMTTALGGQGSGPGDGCFIFVQEGTAPEGSRVDVSKFYPSSVPKGAFRSINDRICAIKITDPSGEVRLAFDKPIKVCFKIRPGEVLAGPAFIDWWNWLKGKWESLLLVPGSAPEDLCASVTQL